MLVFWLCVSRNAIPKPFSRLHHRSTAFERACAHLDTISTRLYVLKSHARSHQAMLDFMMIHPFTDENGRLSSILADVLCLNYGLAPLALDAKNKLFVTAMLENYASRVPIEEQLQLVDGWNCGHLGIRPYSIYDDHPSAFQTYTRRSGDKGYVVEQILAKLADQRLDSPFVVTDIGAGTGVIADGDSPCLGAARRADV